MRSTLAVTGLWLALAGLLWMAPCAHAQSLPRQGSITVYGLAGGINQEMKEVNDILSAQQEELRSDYVPANYKIFGLGWLLGGGAWFQITERFSVGAEYSYQKQDVQNDVYMGQIGTQSGILNGAGGKVQDVTLNLTWYPSLDTGLFVGAGVGYGWSEMYEQVDLVQAAAPELNSTLRGDWTANGITGQAFVGYHFDFVAGTRIQVRGGYRYMKMSSLDGTSSRITVDPVTGGSVVETLAEQLPMGTTDWDFGGFNAVLILGFPFFGGGGE